MKGACRLAISTAAYFQTYRIRSSHHHGPALEDPFPIRLSLAQSRLQPSRSRYSNLPLHSVVNPIVSSIGVLIHSWTASIPSRNSSIVCGKTISLFTLLLADLLCDQPCIYHYTRLIFTTTYFIEVQYFSSHLLHINFHLSSSLL